MKQILPDVDLTPASEQLSTSDIGAAFYLMYIVIFIAVGAYIYFTTKRLKMEETQRKAETIEREAEKKAEAERREKAKTEHERILKELNTTLGRLADVTENTMVFIKETVEHERKNHEQCKDRFFDKLVEIEYYLKSGTKHCDIREER